MKKTNTIFVYGTLSFNQIISTLLGREVRGKLARIQGYKRIRVAGKRYPGLMEVPDKNSTVEGVVHEDITRTELDLLNTFEDDFYTLIAAYVEIENGERAEALTYIIPEGNLHFVSSEEWDRENFKRKHYNDYVEMVRRFRSSYLSGIKKSQEF